MEHTFTNVGEFRRGKGNRKTRLGPRVRVDMGDKRGGRQIQTADEIAIKKLGKILENSLTTNDRYAYTNQMARAEQIRFMNMPVLAQVLIYMNSVGNEITDANFNYNTIRGYIEPLLPRREVMEGSTKSKEIPGEELEIMRLRLAATFLRYIYYVINMRQQAAEELEEAQQLQAIKESNAPPLIDI